MVTMTADNYQGTRITIQSQQTFDNVKERLYGSVGNPNDARWGSIVAKLMDSAKVSQEDFVRAVKSALGPHEFMIFAEFDHGAWVSVFGAGGGLKSKRIIVGNPLIAITMLKHDVIAGLAVPVELLLQEKEDRKSTAIIYQLPSALIARVNTDPELLSAAKELDRKFENLLQYIAE